MHALVKFIQYLVGSKFIIKTDHNSMKHFLSQKELNDKKHRWVSKIQYFDFDIEYKKGVFKVFDGTLSRKLTLAMLKIQDDWRTELAVEYSKNQSACDLLDGMIYDEEYNILNDVI